MSIEESTSYVEDVYMIFYFTNGTCIVFDHDKKAIQELNSELNDRSKDTSELLQSCIENAEVCVMCSANKLWMKEVEREELLTLTQRYG